MTIFLSVMTPSDPSKLQFPYFPSPNFDERPIGIKVDTVVLHATVLNTLDQVIQHFANPASKVSCHYTIDRNGTIAAHVLEDKRAWHVGQSRMKDGRTGVNDVFDCPLAPGRSHSFRCHLSIVRFGRQNQAS
jgi:N-acetyl-anhydromuramyl-L-alanine amidase AmpD